MYTITTPTAIGAVRTAAPDAAALHFTAPLAAPCMGDSSVRRAPAFDWIVVGTRVRDGKQAAPPRGELR